MSDKYNGWTNYETWNVNLWLDNGGFFEDEPHDLDAYDLGDNLKERVEDMAQEWMADRASMFADMINSSLQCVNWSEIAEHWIEKFEED